MRQCDFAIGMYCLHRAVHPDSGQAHLRSLSLQILNVRHWFTDHFLTAAAAVAAVAVVTAAIARAQSA
jgi:hypothetical protein